MTEAQETENKEKFEAINRFLENEFVLIHVNPHHPEVEIPNHLRKDPTVTLKISRLFKGGIEVSNERVLTNLLFQGQYHSCNIPLAAIWGLTSEKGSNLVWPNSTPNTVLKQLVVDANSEPPKQSPSPPNPLSKRGHLRRVK
jgi:stringent starvation protein B